MLLLKYVKVNLCFVTLTSEVKSEATIKMGQKEPRKASLPCGVVNCSYFRHIISKLYLAISRISHQVPKVRLTPSTKHNLLSYRQRLAYFVNAISHCLC